MATTALVSATCWTRRSTRTIWQFDAYQLQGGNFWERVIRRGNRIEPEKVHSCSRELTLMQCSLASVEAEAAPAEPATAEAVAGPSRGDRTAANARCA